MGYWANHLGSEGPRHLTSATQAEAMLLSHSSHLRPADARPARDIHPLQRPVAQHLHSSLVRPVPAVSTETATATAPTTAPSRDVVSISIWRKICCVVLCYVMFQCSLACLYPWPTSWSSADVSQPFDTSLILSLKKTKLLHSCPSCNSQPLNQRHCARNSSCLPVQGFESLLVAAALADRILSCLLSVSLSRPACW